MEEAEEVGRTPVAMLVSTPGSEIGVEDLPAEIRRASGNREVIRSAADRGLSLAELERDYIFEMLRRAGGNKTRAAEILGIPRRTLYRRLDEYAAESTPDADAAAGQAARSAGRAVLRFTGAGFRRVLEEPSLQARESGVPRPLARIGAPPQSSAGEADPCLADLRKFRFHLRQGCATRDEGRA